MRFKHLFLLGMILLLAACQKEKPISPTPEQRLIENFEVKIVAPEDIPHVMNYLESQLADSEVQSLKGYKLDLPFNENRIIEEKINQVEDPESGVTTYTFAVNKKKNEEWIYNLIITEEPDGSFKQISLLRFIFPDWFNIKYNNGEVALNEFKGQVENYFIYSEESEVKNLQGLEPCGNYDYGDPIDGDVDPSCGDCNGGISWSNPDVGRDDITCHWESEWVEVQDLNGKIISIHIVHFEVCEPTEELFTGFDHCEDPDPLGPNDPGIDLPYHQEVVNNWAQTAENNNFYLYDIDALAESESFQALVSQYVAKPTNSITDSEWGEITAKVYKGGYNSLSAGADRHKRTMSLLCDWEWWDQITEVGRKFEEAYNASLQYLPQNSAEWGDMADAFMHFLPEILLEFNPVTAAAVALKDAWLNFDEGRYVVGGLYVAAAIAEFVPWAQVFNKVADVAKVGIKAFKYFRPVASLVTTPTWIKYNQRLLDKVTTQVARKVNDFYTNRLKLPRLTRRIPQTDKPPFKIKVGSNEVQFDDLGFPDFKKFTPDGNGKSFSYVADDLVGNNTTTDFTKATVWLKNKFPGRDIKPDGIKVEIDGKTYTWHHHQDGRTLMPVLKDIHDAAKPHTGGNAAINAELRGFFDGPY